MSDLRFVRELGAEFARLERAGAAEPRRRRFLSSGAKLPGRIAMAVALAVPLAIAVLAIGVLSLSREGGRRPATSAAPQHGLAFSGGNCRAPARTAPKSPAMTPGSDGMIRAASGRISGIAWQLRVKPGTAMPGAVEHGRLLLGAQQYGLCGQQSVPVPFGLVNAGSHGIVYGYVATGGGSYRIAVSAGNTPLTGSIVDTSFFIAALPRPACAYGALTVTATSTRVNGLPPDISRSLDDAATHLTTTMRFGDCRPQALVRAISERSQTQGRSPDAPLAKVTAQLSLIAPPGAPSHARGTVWELAHDGRRGIQLFAFGLTPGRYGVRLLGPHDQVTTVAAVTVKHDEILGSYDLPADAGGRQIIVAARAPGQSDRAGTIVLRATLR